MVANTLGHLAEDMKTTIVLSDSFNHGVAVDEVVIGDNFYGMV